MYLTESFRTRLLIVPVVTSLIMVSSLQVMGGMYCPADSLKQVADGFLQENLPDSAAEYYYQAAQCFLNDRDIRNYLYCRNQEAFSLGLAYRVQEALEISEEILEQYPDSLAAYKYDVYIFWKLCVFNYRLKFYDRAYNYGIKTREIAESYSMFSGRMLHEILDIMISSLRNLGLYDAALRIAFEKLESHKSAEEYLELSHTYNSIGLLYKRYGDYTRAIAYFLKSKELRDTCAPEWSPYVMTNVGEIYLLKKQPDSAAIWFEKSLKGLGDNKGRKSLLHSVLYAELAETAVQKEAYELAVSYMDSCIDVRTMYFQMDDSRLVDFLKQKAQIYTYDGNYDSAHSILEKIRSNYEDPGQSPMRRSGFHLSLAFLYRSEGEKQKALEEIQESFILLSRDFNDRDIFKIPEITDEFYGKDKVLLTLTGKISLIHELYEETGDSRYLNAVIEHYKFALGLINRMINDQQDLSAVSSFFRDYAEIYETAIRSAISLGEKEKAENQYKLVSSYMEASRMNHARLLYQMNKLVNFGGIPDSVIKRKHELERLISRNSSQPDQPGKDLKKDFRLQQELDRINFLIRYENRANNFLNDTNFDLLDEVLKFMGKDQALLQYFFGKEHLYLLYATRDSGNLVSIPWGDKETRYINEYIKLLRDPSQDSLMNIAGSGLYKLLGLDSVLNPDMSELIIIPDRELYLIPFEALRSGNSKYLVEEFTISYENSLFFMMNNRRKSRTGRKFLGLAPFGEDELDPDRTNYRLEEGKDKIPMLPGTIEELVSINRILGGIIKTGEDATETFFRENSASSDIIHIASHTALNDFDPLYNRIILNTEMDSQEDGLLYTHEIYSMFLNADLVTLSACNTGVGRYYDGEGMISLATGFRTAGVRSIVMSLWNLPDVATSEIMVNFYKNLDSGVGKAGALRNAKLEYLENADRNTSHPYFWAATVYTGINQSIPATKGRLMLISAIVLILGILLLIRMLMSR